MTEVKKVLRQSEITDLEYPESVRLRRGMYLPNVDYMVYEIVDNAVDEFMAENCTSISLTTRDDIIQVIDDGAGIPILPSKKDPTKTQAEMAYTRLHSGGKFGDASEGGYGAVKTGGANGVGASVVNALAEYCNLFVYTGGKKYALGFERGITTTPLTDMGSINKDELQHGTIVDYKVDREIWDDKLNLSEIRERMEQLTYLNPGLTIQLDLQQDSKEIQEVHCNPEGLKKYMEKLTKNKETLIDVYTASTKVDDIDISIAYTYTNAYNENLLLFTNNIPNPAGSHLTGLKEGIFGAIEDYYKETTSSKTTVKITSDDCREGMVAILSIKVPTPNYDGQGKQKLDMPRVRKAVRETVKELMTEQLDKSPEEAKIILAKVLQAQKAREAAKRAREASRSKNSLFTGTPQKLTECISKNPEDCEIFIAEGDSAGGTIKDARDNQTMAVLPVFGKISNVEKARIEDVLKSPKMIDAIRALECGIGEEFDIDKLRYHKIIIAADGDIDGLHIQTLWMTFFYRFMRPLIENGHIYLACPPLYKVINKKKEYRFAYSDKERDALLEEMGSNCTVLRYKGLGEMDAEELSVSTTNKDTRTLIQVTIENIEEDEAMISTCMGEDVAPRKEFVMSEDNFGELI